MQKVIDREKQIEFIDGKEVIKEPSSARESGIKTRICYEIGYFLKNKNLGRVYGATTIFTFGQNFRMPDASFISNEKIPISGEPDSKWNFAPDLVVEVVSTNDLYENVFDKLNNYFEAGVEQVWLVEPRFERIRIYKSPEESTTLQKQDTLTCEEILPDFKLPLTEIFID